MICREGLHFTCKNSLCIAIHLQCDGDDDCGDNSDEDERCKIKYNFYVYKPYMYIIVYVCRYKHIYLILRS